MSHLKNNLLVVAQIDGGEFGILLPPLGDVRLVALVALEEVILAEVGQNVAALLGHEHARVFGVGQVDLGDLFGKMLTVGVQLGHQALVDGHARLARGQAVAGIDAGDHRERVMMLGHGRRRHGEQNAVGVDQADLRPWRVNATGWRSTTVTRIWSGRGA